MEILKKIHTIFGILVFFAGFTQILLPKKGKWHLLIGKIYVWSWLPLIITGAAIGSYMILCLGMFGYYNVLSGQQFAVQKTIPKNTYYKTIILCAIFVCMAMTVFSIMLFITHNTEFGVIFAVFGSLFSLTVYKDYIIIIKNKQASKLQQTKQYWYFEHFGRMYISFIAALTAFTSIQNVFNHTLLNWLSPTIIGTFGIIVSNKIYKKKFKLEL